MTRTLWNDAAREAILSRVDRLTPDIPPRWGRMNCGEMLAHVVQGMRVGLGELPTRTHKTIYRHWPLKHLFVYWLPMPKGAPAPRETVTRGKAVDFDRERLALRRAVDTLAASRGRTDWPLHPYFGRLDGPAWAALGWRHLDHHLRQFGV